MTQKSGTEPKFCRSKQSRRVRPRWKLAAHAAWFPHTQADQAELLPNSCAST